MTGISRYPHLPVRTRSLDEGNRRAADAINFLLRQTSELEGRIDLLEAGGGGGGWVSLATFDATSSTTLGENTAVPSTATALRFLFNGVSLDDTSEAAIEFGDATAYTATYVGNVAEAAAFTNFSSSYLAHRGAAAGDTIYGAIELTKLDGLDEWVGTGIINANEAGGEVWWSGGKITLDNSVLTRVKVVSDGGGNFDGGSVEVLYS